MARPREFDTTEALDRAMHVFWEKGYEAASLQDLLGAMNLSKSSFYQAFGSKHDLFMAAIGRYAETALSHFLAMLEEGKSGKRAIERAFARLVDNLACPDGKRGCFVNNCAVEVAPQDPVAEARIRSCQQLFEDGFYGAVRRAQAGGEIPADRDPRALARFLTATVNGLQVMAKTNPERRALEDVVRVALDALD